jgi:hypothetical protein
MVPRQTVLILVLDDGRTSSLRNRSCRGTMPRPSWSEFSGGH